MPFHYKIIDCQNPVNPNNVKNYIDRTYKVLRCEFLCKHHNAEKIFEKAYRMASMVNPRKANDSENWRNNETLILDGLGGVLAEHGWYYYIKYTFGDIVNFTEYKSASTQIDLLLNNGKSIEVRSSFPRNGIEFAICSERYNFKNICKYDNLYKPCEQDKDFFASVLFETQKSNMLRDETIIFYLIGGSTKDMMLNSDHAYTSSLIAEDDLTQIKTNYRVLKLQHALDMDGFESYMQSMGYIKINNHTNIYT